ncbi:MAG TPA: serine hydrolase domain-containing protein [Blastocatellia bacterium]|nr:serine hydrolase domain-containing protein [Blastocatellia bacterium]
MKRLSGIAIICSLLLTSGAAFTNPPDRGVIVSGELGRKIDDFLTRLAGFGYSGAMLVVKDGNTILRKGYGFANRSAGVANTPETLFDIGSLSKQFTAAAIMKLEQDGRLKTTDPISKHLKNVPQDKAQVTIHQLLSHTAGITRNVPLSPKGDSAIYYEEIDREEALKRVLPTELVFEPGTKFQYSNAGYMLLAAIVEIASGQKYQEYLKKNLFEPAAMRNTGFAGRWLPSVKQTLVARGHDELGEVGNPLKWSGESWLDLGGGGVVSTVGDLYKWQQALANNRTLSRESTARMFTQVRGGYGYGWNIKETPRKTTLIEHGGDFAGFGSQLWWFKDEGIVVISLCNIRDDNNEYPTRFKADPKVLNIIFNEPYAAPPAFVAADPKVVKKIAGTYRLESGAKLIVRVDRGQLEIGADGQEAADALAEADAKEIERRVKLGAMTKRFLEGMVVWNPEVVKDALGPNGDLDYWRAGWDDESRQLGGGKGQLKSIEVLGVAPGGFPRGIQNVIARFNYERGASPYKITWLYRERFSKDIIGGTYLRSADLSAVTPLQAESRESFAGWNIVAEKGFRVSFEFTDGEVTGLKVHGKNNTWSARKVA